MSKETRIPLRKFECPLPPPHFASFIARGKAFSNSSSVYSGGVRRIAFLDAITDSFKSYTFTFVISTILFNF